MEILRSSYRKRTAVAIRAAGTEVGFNCSELAINLKWLPLQLRIREFPGSYLDPKTSYGFPQSLKMNAWTVY